MSGLKTGAKDFDSIMIEIKSYSKTDYKQKVWRSILTDAPKILGGTFSKNGTHLHDKNTRKIYGWFSGCCRGIVTDCEQMSDKTTRTSREVKYVA